MSTHGRAGSVLGPPPSSTSLRKAKLGSQHPFFQGAGGQTAAREELENPREDGAGGPSSAEEGQCHVPRCGDTTGLGLVPGV